MCVYISECEWVYVCAPFVDRWGRYMYKWCVREWGCVCVCARVVHVCMYVCECEWVCACTQLLIATQGINTCV